MQSTDSLLTEEQRAFVREFLVDLDGTAAAIRCGIRPEDARAGASALLRTPAISNSIADVLVRRATSTVSLPRMLRNIATRTVPFRYGLKKVFQVMAARAGYEVRRIPRPSDRSSPPGSAGSDKSTASLQAYHKGRCFYCRGDSPIAQRVLRGEDWDPHLKKILHRVCDRRKSGTIVEVGANIGATFLPECAALQQFRFVLFEPVPTFFEILERNVASFGASNVVLHNAAVSDGRSSDILLIHDDVSGGIAAASSFVGHQKVAIVRSVALDEMFPNETIAVLKADVDGYELDVLRGGRDLIARSRPDVLLEFNPLAIEVRGFTPADIPDFLVSVGIDTFDLYTDDGVFMETTTSPARIYEAFRALKQPLGHIDVHAYAKT